MQTQMLIGGQWSDGSDTEPLSMAELVRVVQMLLVAGPVEHLAVTPDQLDSLWGVFEGSDASWVFLDSFLSQSLDRI